MSRPLPRRVLRTFLGPDGETRELRNPDAPASGRQLQRLNAAGYLELVEHAEPLTMGEAAAAVAALSGALEELDGGAQAEPDPDGADSAQPRRRHRAGGFA